MSRTRAVAVLVLLSALGLTGCSDNDPEPRFEPPASETSASPTTTTAAASVDSPEDVVRAWVEAQTAAMASGDTDPIRVLSATDCESCDGLIEPIEQVFSSGGHFETDGWTVDRAKETRSSDGRSTVIAAVTIAGGTTYQSADAEPVVYETERAILEFRLTEVDNEWLVSFVGFVS